MFENLVEHVYKRHIRSDPSLHPVLMSEASVSKSCFVIIPLLFMEISAEFKLIFFVVECAAKT